MLRVTEGMGRMTTERELARLSFDLLQRQRQATDGKRVAQASDDPTAARAVVELDRARDANAQYQRNVERGLGDLDEADDALYSATEVLQEAATLALQLANDTMSTQQRLDAANTVRGLRDRLVASGNAEGANGSIFAGHQTDGPAFDATGAYLGDAGQHQLQIGDSLTKRVGLTGDEVFRPTGGEDAFAALADLEAALTADDQTAIAAAGGRLETSRQQVAEARTRIGDQLSTLLRQGEDLDERHLSLEERRVTLVEVNAVDAMSDYVEAKGALESAIRITGDMLNTISLVGQL